jgi:hypothetical protein
MRVMFQERTVTMLLKTQAATEVAQFLAYHPTPEQIVAFHPSPEVAERAYELIYADRDGELTEEERKELESYTILAVYYTSLPFNNMLFVCFNKLIDKLSVYFAHNSMKYVKYA